MWEPLQIFTVKSQDRKTQLVPWLCSLPRGSEQGLWWPVEGWGLLANLGPFVDSGEMGRGWSPVICLWVLESAEVDPQRPSEL